MEKARDTIIRMLKERGYTNINKDPVITATKDEKEPEFIKVVFIERLDASGIKTHISSIEKSQIKNLIIVYENTPTPSIYNPIELVKKLGIEIELFSIADLQYVVIDHVMVPKHVKTFGQEYEEVVSKCGNKLPILLHTDAVARFYGFKQNDIIRVERPDGIIYRIVR